MSARSLLHLLRFFIGVALLPAAGSHAAEDIPSTQTTSVAPSSPTNSRTASAALEATVAQIDDIVAQEMVAQRIPGLALAVISRGEIVRATGYGFANVEHRTPVSRQTVFQSASVGKMFTGAAVMLLVEDGRVSLNDSISRFFPEAPAAWRSITLRHLLTHTSGIPDYIDDTLDLRKDFTEEEFLHRTFTSTLEFPAGQRWNYSNTGYVLLGFIVRRASGKFYGDFLRERVFTPLGMSSARVISDEDIVEHRAAGYRIVNGQLKNQPWVAPSLNSTADGSLYLSADDLIRWDRAVRERAVLKPSSWQAVHTPVRLQSEKTYPYGFGWFLPNGSGPARIGHIGHTWGFTSAYTHLLDEDLTVLMLCNLDGVDERRVMRRVAGVIVPAMMARRGPQSDPDPALAERVLELTRQSANGTLRAEDFESLRAGMLSYMNELYKVRLQGTESFEKLSLLERREVGDDLHVEYRAHSGNRTFIAIAEVGPGGRFTYFDVRPETAD